ncbi:MAG: hypothetical protein HGA85_00490 [Nanoarchaeota archaeon]|nr:hypothetical protein [Nanoarchaeota archaeon]
MRKAQSMSINTVVVAAIALLILVVIIAIFAGRIKIFTGGTQDCGTQQGSCMDKLSCPLGNNVQLSGTNCDKQNLPEDNPLAETYVVCCVPIIKQ